MTTGSPRTSTALGLLRTSLVLAVVCVAGCDANRLGLGADDDSNGGNDSCMSGQRMCEGQNLMVCQNGSYAHQATCPNNQRCDQELGCIECLPAGPNLCVGDTVRRCNPNGSIGDVVETCQPGMCSAGSCGINTCATGADLVYVVDEQYELLSFNPRDDKNEFKLIGKLRCPASQALDGSGEATPFSMSVDRSGHAWVLYNSGEIFNVSTSDAKCTATKFSTQQNGFDVFGMGFVSNAAGSSDETLFIAGGAYDNLTSGNLGSLDTATLSVKKIGALQIQGQHSPELTGTGKAELYGYFPGTSAFVAQIDKTTGKNLQKWNIPAIPGSGNPLAWAFAHWGGRFYIFITVSSGSYVYRLDPASGMTVKITPNATYKIVGAGVSTCAPIVIG